MTGFLAMLGLGLIALGIGCGFWLRAIRQRMIADAETSSREMICSIRLKGGGCCCKGGEAL